MDPITFALGAVATSLLEIGTGKILEHKTEKRALKQENKKAKEQAINLTISNSNNPKSAKLIIDSLNSIVKQADQELFANELKKILLVSETPDIERLADMCQSTLNYRRGVKPDLLEISRQEIEQTLSELIKNLGSSLIDQPTYKKLFTSTEQLKVSKKQLDEQIKVNEFLQEIVSNTKQNKSKRLDFYSHIPYPQQYVKRERFLTDLVEKILLDNDIPIVLHGMSGIGKSTIARAICEFPDIQNFYDGIIMLKLGQKPSIISIFKSLIEQLGGDYNSDDLSNLKQVFSQCIDEKKMLLIVDDAWNFSDVENFKVGHSKLFITTQKVAIAEKLGVEITSCKGMDANEGLELFNKWLGNRRNSDSEEIKTKILNKLGYHPLAIKLAGANLAKHHTETCENWLEQFDINRLELKPIEGNYDSLKVALQVTFDSLSPLARSLYKEIGIFLENEPIPFQVIKGLWQYNIQYEATINLDDLLDEIIGMALLDVIDDQAVQLHSLLLTYLRDQLDDKEKKRINQNLIEYYRKLQQKNNWSTVQSDNYYYDFLAYHLVEAGMMSELYSLLLDSPEWWQAKLNYSKGSSYIDDIKTAISTFSEPITNHDLIILFQLYVARDAVQQVATNYLEEELQIMVWRGEKEKALRLARLKPENYFNSILAIQKTLKDMNLQIVDHNLLIHVIEDIRIIEEKICAYIDVAEAYLSTLDEADVNKIYDTAIKIAKSNLDSGREVKNLIQIIRSLLKSDRKDFAKQLASEIYSSQDLINDLDSGILAELLNLSIELKISDSINKTLVNNIIIKLPEKDYVDALAYISASVIKAGFLQEGISIINKIELNYWKMVAFSHTADLYHKAGNEENVDKFLNYSFQLLQSEYNVSQFDGDAASYMLVRYLVQTRRFYQATDLAHSLKYLNWRGLAFGVLIEGLVDAGLIEDARQCYLNCGNIIIEKRISLKLQLQAMKMGISDFFSNTPAILDNLPDEKPNHLINKLHNAVNILIDDGKLDDAMWIASKVPKPQDQVPMLLSLAIAYLFKHDMEKVRQICNQVENITQSENDLIEHISLLMYLRHILKDFDRANELCQRALELARKHENCYSLSKLFEFAYLTKGSDNNLWSSVFKHFDDIDECKDSILEDLAQNIDIEKEEPLLNYILTRKPTYEHSLVGALETLAKRAIEENTETLLNKILLRFRYYVDLPEEHTSYIEGFARILAKMGNFKEALLISEKISNLVSRASIQVQIASSMFKNNLEDEARQIFMNANMIISNIQTFGGWDYPLSKWTASLFGKGYYLEALSLYQPNIISDYMRVLKDWEEELSVINIELKKTLFLKFVHIYSWVDTEWLTVAQYLKDIDYS